MDPHGKHKENSYGIYTKGSEKCQHFTTKNQLNTKEDSNVGKEGQKSYKPYRKKYSKMTELLFYQ